MLLSRSHYICLCTSRSLIVQNIFVFALTQLSYVISYIWFHTDLVLTTYIKGFFREKRIPY